MTEERIRVEIDDTQLDAYIAKLQVAKSLSLETFDTRSAIKGAKALDFTLTPVADNVDLLGRRLGELGITIQDLPTLNRNLRIIVGRIPGMRNLMQYWFRVRWMARGLTQFIETGVPTSLLLTLIATTFLLVDQVMRLQRRLERAQQRYETFVRRARDWTHEEYISRTREWENYLRSLPG